MHAVQVAHRDLKLANVLLHFPDVDLLDKTKEEQAVFIRNVDFTKERFEIKISDFGFARLILPD